MAKKDKIKNDPAPAKEVKKSKKSKADEADSKPEDTVKKPQRGLAIGDNFGWTGKLPATLLFEHAQKQKWEKVIIDMKKVSNGLVGIINLSWKNPKTHELIHVRMIPESSMLAPKETALEARHFAATYALHRINFSKNMKMVLPKIFRDFWSDLEIQRAELLKSDKDKHNIKFNSDPFTVFIEQRELNEKREKERLVKLQNEEKIRRPAIMITSNSKPSPSRSKSSTPEYSARSLPPKPKVTFPRKVWSNATSIDLTPESRELIEKSIKQHINWTIEVDNTTATSSSTTKEDYTQSLIALGFRKVHVDESLKHTATFTDSLEWLLFHIPEDDLPSTFLRSEQDTNVSLTISRNLQQENLVNRLLHSGMDKYEVVAALKEHDNDEVSTAVELTHSLIGYKYVEGLQEESDELWDEEIESLKIIYEDRIKDTGDKNIVDISLSPANLKPDMLHLRVFKSVGYPDSIPGLQIVVNNQSYRLANYIKLSILRQLLHYVIENSLVGDCMIYSLISWLEDNISNIIESPGPLFDEELFFHSDNSAKTKSSTGKKAGQKGASSLFKHKKLSDSDRVQLRASYEEKQNSSSMRESLSNRARLPAWKKKDQLIELINSNPVTLVTGETGSGKSTQIVQFILDDLNSKGDFTSSIICTQPRRISTIGLAERISDERCDKCGNETGYTIRGENKTNANTRIAFVTTGVLLRMIQSLLETSNTSKSNPFNNITYIFVDEVHERSIDSDFLLIILRKIMKRFTHLRIILMSATIDLDVFKNFFKSKINHIHIEGRTFPIKDYYLDEILDNLDYTITTNKDEVIKPRSDSHFFKSGTLNYDLIGELVLFIDEKLKSDGIDGSILIFLPGIMEINLCIRKISQISSKFHLLPLHSALSNNDQRAVFSRPPRGQRKIVVSTNVAETSITIPDCVVVVDSGRSKNMFYDPKLNGTKLIENWCSKAEVNQRRGRSGRITNGNCYKLYTAETQVEMLNQPIPEIKRTRLENIYLIVKSMGINNVEDFLNKGLDPPEASQLLKSREFLEEVGALFNDNITHLGKYLSLIPTDLQSGKLLIFGCLFQCLEPCLTLAAINSAGSPFLNSFENRDKIKQIQASFSGGDGDLIAMVNVFNEYLEKRNSLSNKDLKNWISNNYLSFLNLKEIISTREQYTTILEDLGFIPLKYQKQSSSNKNVRNTNILKGIITGAFYPQIARVQIPDPKYIASLSGAIAVDPDAKQTKFWIRNDDYNPNEESNESFPASRAFLHPASVLFSPNSNTQYAEKNKEDTDEKPFDFSEHQKNYKVDFTPTVNGPKNAAMKASFVIFKQLQHAQKVYMRDITPTTTLAVLLFGGSIDYDLTNVSSGKPSPGLVLDNWLPIRTWCKNGVLIKQLRKLLDNLIEQRLASSSSSYDEESKSDVLSVVERVLAWDFK